MPDRPKFIERGKESKAYRERQQELAHIANKPYGAHS